MKSSKAPIYAFVMVIPLLFAYEFIALGLNRSQALGVRNGADVFLKQLLALVGIHGLFAYSLVLISFLGVIYWRSRRVKGLQLKPRYFALMVLESLVYALFFGLIVEAMTRIVLSQPHSRLGLLPQIMLSLGAGVYEELVFRVLLVSGFYFLMAKILKVNGLLAYASAAIFASLLFSTFHYLGPLGDDFSIHTFLFRFFAGIVFSAIYILRGFGITAYTHTFYDLFLILR